MGEAGIGGKEVEFSESEETKILKIKGLLDVWTPAEMWWHTVKHVRGKWRGNLRMEWVASTLHTTSELGVSSNTTNDTHTSTASIRLNWRPRRFKWTRPFCRKTKSGFCACAITFQKQSKSMQGYDKCYCLLLMIEFLFYIYRKKCINIHIRPFQISDPIEFTNKVQIVYLFLLLYRAFL